MFKLVRVGLARKGGSAPNSLNEFLKQLHPTPFYILNEALSCSASITYENSIKSLPGIGWHHSVRSRGQRSPGPCEL
jgi:hypothetical protein